MLLDTINYEYALKIMKIFTVLLSLFGFASYSSAETTEVDNQLWIMIKMDTYFRTVNELKMVDKITEIIEGANLGYLDGHSSGAYQFDFNYYKVNDFDRAKSKIQRFIEQHYPNVTFTISNDYLMTYEKH